jgi:hypothetical protein
MSLVILGVGRVLTTRHHRRRTGPMGSGMCRFLLTKVRVAAAATSILLLLLAAAAGALVSPGRCQRPRGTAGAAAPVRVAGRCPRVLVPLHAHGLVQSAKLRVRIGCVRPGQKGCTRPASACRADRFSPQENRVPAKPSQAGKQPESEICRIERKISAVSLSVQRRHVRFGSLGVGRRSVGGWVRLCFVGRGRLFN